MIEAVNLNMSFHSHTGTVHALQGVSLQVNVGEFVAVRGASGSGKTTLLLACAGLRRPDSGHVRLLGTDLYSIASPARAKLRAESVGFVFQQFHLIPYLSVLQNIMAPCLGSKIQHAESRAKELLDQFGLSRRAGHYPQQLSTGERQRAALSRALLNSPKILFADEPTGNLDPDNAALVLQALRSFARNGGAVLLVTHHEDSARTADRTITLKEGKPA